MDDAHEHPAISVDSLSKRYADGSQTINALEEVSLDISSGSITGILGPNGAGKTTLIKCLLGLIEPTAGTIRINGAEFSSNTKEIHNRVSAVLEGSRNIYWRLSVAENLRFFSALSGNRPGERAAYHEQLLTRFGIEHKRDTAVRELSRGQKQKTAILCAFARDPDVVFLDEPTLGLDIQSGAELRAQLTEMAASHGHTIIVTSHDMDVIQDICDRVIILVDGEISVSASVENLLDQFHGQSYEIQVADSLSEQTRHRLRDRLGAHSFRDQRGKTRFEFETDPGTFYETIAEFESAGLSVETLETTEPDLEEIFVEIAEQETAPPAPEATR